MKIYNNILTFSFTKKLLFSVFVVLGSVIFPGSQTSSKYLTQNAGLLLSETTTDDVTLTAVDSSTDSASAKTSENSIFSTLPIFEHQNSFYDSYETNWKKAENFNAEFQLNSAIAISSTELIPAGSYVIAMDDALQGGSNFNLKTYGLIVRLLHADIPLKWAIKSGKSKDGTDFSVNASRIKPSSQGSS